MATRKTIRIPADVELSTDFLSLPDTELQGAAQITIESVPGGKFSRVVKISVSLPTFGEVLVVYAKERKAI